MSKDDFFIGWAETPKVDRRFFTTAGLALMVGTGGAAGFVAAKQLSPGPGAWDMANVREWRGIVTSEPYAMLRTTDLDGTPRTALLACQGKCGVARRLDDLSGKAVIVKGSLIARENHAMIAVIDGPDWIMEDETAGTLALEFPNRVPITQVTLKGEILDSKCWFGAMRPSEGKVHKACASLCIRGGIPPAFYVKDRRDQKALMIMTANGMAHQDDLLPFVADPVEVTGQLYAWGDLFLLDSSTAAIRRV